MKILAVEDQPLPRLVLKHTLTAQGHEVLEAANGEEAWRILETERVRIVVSDWLMPGVDGLELCRKIRQRGGDYIYFILLTGMDASRSNEHQAITAGVDDFLLKPVAPHELCNRLRVAERILGYTSQVKQLESFLPICGLCHRVRNDDHYWQQIEAYLAERTGAAPTRGICPDCYQTRIAAPLQELALTEPAPTRAVSAVQLGHGQQRPTLGMIAQRLSVSVATVSMALRNSPRISEAVRARARAVATEIGYQPDPTLSKMMRHLRVRRPTAFKSIICALTTLTPEQESPYAAELIRGAQTQAVQRGYGLSVLRLTEGEVDSERLERSLLGRGVEGVLLLPMHRRISCRSWLNWNLFSVAASALSVIDPDVDRVVSHWSDSVNRIFTELAQLGHRRIGLVISEQFDCSLHHLLSSGLAWQSLHGPTEPVVPFIYAGSANPSTARDWRQTAGPRAPGTGQNLAAWFKREAPDALVVVNEHDARSVMEELGLHVPGRIAITLLNRYANSPLAGITERPFEVGSAAIDLLDRKIQSDEKGIPKIPAVTQIKGFWTPAAAAAPCPTS